MQLNFITYCLTGNENELNDFRQNLLSCEQSSEREDDCCTPRDLNFITGSKEYNFFWWKDDGYELKTAYNGQPYIEWGIAGIDYPEFRKLIENHYPTIHIYFHDSYLNTNDEHGVFFNKLVNINGINYLLPALNSQENWAVLHIDENIQDETLTVEPFVEYSGKKYQVTELINTFLEDEYLESLSTFPPRLKTIIIPKGIRINEDSFKNFNEIKIVEI